MKRIIYLLFIMFSFSLISCGLNEREEKKLQIYEDFNDTHMKPGDIIAIPFTKNIMVCSNDSTIVIIDRESGKTVNTLNYVVNDSLAYEIK